MKFHHSITISRTRKMEGEETDNISSLPEALLLNILSSLPFKEAAKTCILSKKWLKMWQSTNTVKNNQLECKDVEAYGAVEVAQRKAFKNFIKIWITLHKCHHLHDKFTLRVSPPSNCGDIVGAYVNFAVEDGVKDLELDFAESQSEDEHPEENIHDAVEFPRSLYENKKLHQKLESLKLHSCSFAPGNFANFVALKDVTLARIPLELESIRTLLSTCEWMESLSLKNCWDIESFDIEKLELKKLVIDRCIFRMDYIGFEAPNLKVFKYCGSEPPLSEVKVVAGTIEEADLDLSPMDEFDECGNELQNFLQDFFVVNVLTVCSVILQVIPSGDEPVKLPGDLRVRHLKMKIQMHPQEFCGFLWFLNSCPRLTKVTIDLDRCNILSEYEAPYVVDLKDRKSLPVPTCFRSSLREVEMNGFIGTSSQLYACSYFIRAASILTKLSICFLNNKNDDPHTVELRRILESQLLRIPKASSDLAIIIR
ncbi:putative F-box/LRR-repeat protein At5g54820 [Arachis stenosperma]|uniref:putative F-box/LRR-repeat protein At5g54820 n=1 Tax=Arachis stenosperma TaxID=217475 RepID=UPI0025AB9862|nr:putative F-box/LRR-repeat protein At5g54820 [Arachis stenosperma]